MSKYETDIVVIAGGPSGLAAAVQAAEDGAKVILVEKSETVGGAANMGMGPLGIGTKYQQAQMHDITVEKAFRMMMEYTHYNIDARLVKRYFDQSAETIEWLEDMGVEFEGAFKYFTKSEPTWHIVKTDQGIGARAASFMNRALYNRALELGVTVLLETPAKKIIMEDGAVAGVLVADKEGNEFEIACKAAIICTGGAGANPEMIKEETGYIWGKDMFNFAIPGNVGDGIRMAWEAGGDHVPVRVEQAASNILGMGLPRAAGAMMNQPNLLVNSFGLRFMDEEQVQNRTYLSNAVSHQKDRTGFMIIDSTIAKYYMKNGIDFVSMVDPETDVSEFPEAAEIGRKDPSLGLFVADTLEELAELAGIDAENLVQTVEDYNHYCETYDAEFFKRREFMKPLQKGPYYACKIMPGGYGTVGGIRINENCEVCDSDFYPIEGLYAAGADACNLYDDSYMFLLPGNSMGWAVNSGRIAGMEAAALIQDLNG